jgi:hypothetical protein
MTRKIKKVLKSKPTIEGAGVHLKRAFEDVKFSGHIVLNGIL